MVLKENVRIIRFEGIEIVKEDGTKKYKKSKGSNIMAVQFHEADRPVVGKFLSDLYNKKDWYKKELALVLTLREKKRSLDQNALYWALISILAFEVYGEYGFEEAIHEEILELYSPRIIAKLTGRGIPKRSKDMNVYEFSYLIQGVFYQLAEHGVKNVVSAGDIRRYWQDWYKWRGTSEHDPVGIENADDYRKRVNFCEACMEYLGAFGDESYKGNICHIASRGSGGEDETWNYLHLCGKCHLLIQHQKGWNEFVETYLHLEWKIDRARKALGIEEKDFYEGRKEVGLVKRENPIKQIIVEKRNLFYHPESHNLAIGTNELLEQNPLLVIVSSAEDVNSAMFAVANLLQEKKITRENAEAIAQALHSDLETYEIGIF